MTKFFLDNSMTFAETSDICIVRWHFQVFQTLADMWLHLNIKVLVSRQSFRCKSKLDYVFSAHKLT